MNIAFFALQETVESDYSREGKIDWLVIHNAGCTCDDTDLPHHISDPREIQELLRQAVHLFERLLSLNPPKMVTVARSALDEFCPPDQVEEIQVQVVQKVQDLFDNVNVYPNYNQDK